MLTFILAASFSLLSSPHLTRSHSHHVLLTIVQTTGVLIVILLMVIILIESYSSYRAHRVVLIVLCRICQLSFVSNMLSNAMRIKTGLLHVMIAAMGVMLGACAGNVK